MSAEAQAAAFEGRLRDAGTLYQHAIDIALARGLSGTASGYAAHLAWTEALYRDPHAPADHIKRVIARSDAETESPGTIPGSAPPRHLDWQAWLKGHSLINVAERHYPESTFVHTVLVPTTRSHCAVQGASGRRDQRPARGYAD